MRAGRAAEARCGRRQARDAGQRPVAFVSSCSRTFGSKSPTYNKGGVPFIVHHGSFASPRVCWPQACATLLEHPSILSLAESPCSTRPQRRGATGILVPPFVQGRGPGAAGT